MMDQADASGETILVVDDRVDNLNLLEAHLSGDGYRILKAARGATALELARAQAPDIVLLDIMMPEMDGYEVCRRLKADPALQDIPVLFISALDGSDNMVKGFAAGGVDYVAKPFQYREVASRVRTHLQIRRQKRSLQQAYDRLKQLEDMRDELVHMVVHDMRSPLSCISGYLELAMASDPAEEIAGYLEEAFQATNTLVDQVSSLLDVSRLEAGEMPVTLAPCCIGDLVDAVCRRYASIKGSRALETDAVDREMTIVCDRDLLTRTLQNLVGNALKFTPKTGTVRIGATREGDRVRLFVADNGPGIPEAYRSRVFEKFGQVEARRAGRKFSTGIGLAFCKLAVEAQGGCIALESPSPDCPAGPGGPGCTFRIELPDRHD